MKKKLFPQKRRHRWLRDLLLFGIIAFLALSYQQRHMINGHAPALSSLTIEGAPISLSTTEPTLIYFWGTWCPVCRVTSPMVNTLVNDHHVITIAVGSGSDEEIAQFMREHDYQFKVINDTSNIHQQWGALAFPAIYIIDPQGDIRFVTSGITSNIGLKLRLLIASIYTN
ncbi:protein disulfide oxidoreductase [Shewanella psychrotolerans]|uniref:protein disulfide oxidoreductase n=1 Tax=Shewanella psychrotolerans TaxID=2864206 RepID=UPI0021ACD48D|nr:protein disulfide oxidoreductase [Shewanella psychrotolerans]